MPSALGLKPAEHWAEQEAADRSAQVVTMATIAIATSPAMNAYSITVTPDLLRVSFLIDTSTSRQS